jgi:hypothetical protein
LDFQFYKLPIEKGGNMAKEWMNTKEYFITYSILINAARHHGFATYQELAQATGYPTIGSYISGVFGKILGDISINEVQQKRPMLSAIAIGISGMPSEGFFTLARELGLLKEGIDEEAFWLLECKRVYEEWKIPYRKSLGKE